MLCVAKLDFFSILLEDFRIFGGQTDDY